MRAEFEPHSGRKFVGKIAGDVVEPGARASS